MPKYQLDLLSGTASINIWKYELGQVSSVSSTDKQRDFSFIKKNLDEAAPNNYTILKYQTAYLLVIPVSKTLKLLILPKVENMIDGEQKFSNLDFLNQTNNLARMVYFFYTGKKAPDWPFVVDALVDKQHRTHRISTLEGLESFHRYSNQLLKTLDHLDEKEFNDTIDLLQHCNVLDDLLSEVNIIRGEKDLLVGLVAKLTQCIERSGMPIKEAVALQTLTMQRIELNSNMENFEIWLEEIPRIFFNTLQEFRKYLFKDKAEQIEHFIRENVARNIQLKEISSELDIAQQSLNAIFKKRYGITIRQYLIRLKIKSAKKMLTSTKLKGKDIAKCLSFVDESYFVLTFNKLCGMTPSKYRESHLPTVNPDGCY